MQDTTTKTTPAKQTASSGSPSQNCYALYSGWVQSLNDRAWHKIGFTDLIRLYRLNPKQCFDGYDEDKWAGKSRMEVIELHPRQDGNYSLHNIRDQEPR